MKRQFMRGEKESLPGAFFGNPFHLIKNTTWTDHGYPIFRSALSFSHPGFRRFLSNRFVREDANPDPAGPLDESGHGNSSGLNLTCSQPTSFYRLQSEVTKVEGIPPGSHSSSLPLLLLSIFCLLRHQHDSITSKAEAEVKVEEKLLKSPTLALTSTCLTLRVLILLLLGRLLP